MYRFSCSVLLFPVPSYICPDRTPAQGQGAQPRGQEDGFGSRARDGAPEAGSPRQEGADDGRAADGRGCGREPRFAGRGEVRRVVLGGKERRLLRMQFLIWVEGIPRFTAILI